MWKKLLSLGVVGIIAVSCSRSQTDGSSLPTGGNTTGTIALTSGECKQLGGKVETNPSCGITGKICITVTVNPVTNQQQPHQLCIDKAD
jgi:hypothetical protein